MSYATPLTTISGSSRKRSFSTGRLLRRPHQHDADAPVDGFVTALHTLARKLLVALWKYVTAGVVIEGAAMKSV
jgi:hypothetical protein